MPFYRYVCSDCGESRGFPLSFAEAQKQLGEHPSEKTFRCDCGGMQCYDWGTPGVWIAGFTDHGYNAVRDPMTDYAKHVLDPFEKEKKMRPKERMAHTLEKAKIRRDKAAFDARKAAGHQKIIVGAN